MVAEHASNAYNALLKRHGWHGLISSMSRKGNCWDNAVAENFFGVIKKEYIYCTTFKTRAQAQLRIFDFIEAWYNNCRIHYELGYLTPNEFESLNINLAENRVNKISKNIELSASEIIIKYFYTQESLVNPMSAEWGTVLS